MRLLTMAAVVLVAAGMQGRASAVQDGAAVQRRGAPTFNGDVARILHDNCASCHRPGEVAPFPLLTYEDAVKRAALIAQVTALRVMPPWKAEPGHGSFVGERRLSDEQIAVLRQWATAGAPEGDPAQRPMPPQFPQGWQIGEPDQIISMAEPYTVPADGPDQFRCFVLPLDNADRDLYVSGFEFRPGNPRVVHHAIIFIDGSGTGRRLAERSGGSYRCVGGPGFPAAGAIGGWAPGADPRREEPEIAMPVPRGADLVVQIHYHPSGKPEQDRSTLGLHYSGPPTKGRAGMLLINRRIYIPPGDAHHVIKAAITVPQDVDLVGITPHAHYLATDMKVDAVLPDGGKTPLIWIRDWDFNWQGQYRYAEPVRLPKGTRIEMEYVYDNSAGNPRNPSNPPTLVTWGEETNDEMAIAFLEFVLPSPADVASFRLAALLEIIEPFLAAGGRLDDLPPGVGGAGLDRLRRALAMFDADKNGQLDDAERDALLKLVRQLAR